MMTVTRLTAAAISNTIIIGLISCRRKRLNIDVFFASFSLFFPFASSLDAASSAESPSGEDFTSSKTSFVSDK